VNKCYTEIDLEPQAELNFEEERLCTRVAKFYYEGELTQQEIARKLGISRIKVHRILNRAREMGIVEIKIHHPKNDAFIEQEHEIALRYDLRDVVIVPMPEHGETLYGNLAKGAARWLAGKLEPNIRVGLGLGRTISHLPRYFHVQQKTDCVFMEVVGGAYENSGGIAKYNITSKMAEIAGGRAELLYAPNMVSNPDLRNSLVSEPGIAEALAHARKCDIVLQSVGTVDETAILLIEDRISLDEIHSLQEAGAVGDALGHYFDRHGKPVSTFLDDRVIGISLDDLQAIPWSVVVAGGTEKHAAIRAALEGNYFSVMVTDAETADYLLSML
jgi:DNA-binding transcriptional regulator LsrR (DeoR family)